MKEKNILYTILSILALIIVIVGIVFAYKAYDNENKIQENNTLNN